MRLELPADCGQCEVDGKEGVLTVLCPSRRVCAARWGADEQQSGIFLLTWVVGHARVFWESRTGPMWGYANCDYAASLQLRGLRPKRQMDHPPRAQGEPDR
jgi:hypothetical protein